MQKYKLIYADPPWQFSNKNTGGSMTSGADAQYPTMTIDDLKRMDIPSIADKDCLLVMWWVGSMPQEAIDLVHAWGFTTKNMNGFVWNKLTKHGKPFFGMGFYTRAGSESCIIATRGKPKIVNHGVRAVACLEMDSFIASASVGKHSAKPGVFRKRCLQLMGNVPRLEMFARQAVAGWDVFGNEAPGSISIPFIKKCDNCKNLTGQGACEGQPFSVEYCSAGCWEGGDDEGRCEPEDPWINCKFYKVKA